MDRVFVDNADLTTTAVSWSASWDGTQPYAALAQAATHASQTGQARLASLVLAVPVVDALHMFRAFQERDAGACFYWEQPNRQMALVGAGTALAIETNGPGRFEDAAATWKQLHDEALLYDLTGNPAGIAAHGPALFGGFSFDQQRPATALWKNFPGGLFILPRLLFTQHSGRATLTFSSMIRANDDLDRLANALKAELAHLKRRIDSLPDLPNLDSLEAQERHYQGYPTRDLRPAASWKELVEQAIHAIQRGKYAKIVLAREVEVVPARQSFTPETILQHLRQSYPGANVFAFQRGKSTFIGATPERLVHAHDGTLHTMALAGSAPRGISEEEDNRLGSELLQSAKNRQEHAIVEASLRKALTPLCSKLWIADTPELLRLKNIQHLQTAIVGELRPEHSLLETLAALHPTPAVGGSPTEEALAFIRQYEGLDRGWYAGPIGWIDLQGNGEFAVALRSALLEPERARLFAGCGIVADSDPEAEYAESCLKLQVILRNLSEE